MVKSAIKERTDTATTRCLRALEDISSGITDLEECGIESLPSDKYIDVIARLNAQVNGLDTLLKPHKDRLKSKILQDNPGSNQDKFIEKGSAYQAVLRRISKTVMKTEEVKKYLGSKLGQFMTTRDELQLSFEVKE